MKPVCDGASPLVQCNVHQPWGLRKQQTCHSLLSDAPVCYLSNVVLMSLYLAGVRAKQESKQAEQQQQQPSEHQNGQQQPSDVVNQEYNPLCLAQYADASVLTFPTFDAALDEFYSKVSAISTVSVLHKCRRHLKAGSALQMVLAYVL